MNAMNHPPFSPDRAAGDLSPATGPAARWPQAGGKTPARPLPFAAIASKNPAVNPVSGQKGLEVAA